MHKRNCSQPAFTLIELLVVIVIIALLLSIVIPSLVRVKERARRTICQANIRSFHIAINAYAANNDDLLPQGGTDDEDHNFIIIMKHTIYGSLTDGAFSSLVCPNLFKPYHGGNVNVFDHGSYIDDNDTYLLGYNYLGGFPITPWPLTGQAEAEWISPQKSTENPRLPVITELNTWIDGSYTMTFGPHGYWGPIHESKDSANSNSNGVPSDQIGAVGGNICTLDGAIQWKEIEDMEIRRASTDPTIDIFAYW